MRLFRKFNRGRELLSMHSKIPRSKTGLFQDKQFFEKEEKQFAFGSHMITL